MLRIRKEKATIVSLTASCGLALLAQGFEEDNKNIITCGLMIGCLIVGMYNLCNKRQTEFRSREITRRHSMPTMRII